MTYTPTGEDLDGVHFGFVPDKEDVWEHMLRRIDEAMEEAGWDAPPKLMTVHYTAGDALASVMVQEVALPPEQFMANPLLMLDALLMGLKENKEELRDKFAQLLGDSPLYGVILSNEGWAFEGTKEEVDALHARARREGKRFEEYKEDRVEVRVTTAIPIAERKFFGLKRVRGEVVDKVDYAVTDNHEDIVKMLRSSRTHGLLAQLMVEFAQMQREANGWGGN